MSSDNEITDSSAQKNEALKLKLAFWKFVIGTVSLSVLTAVLNWQIQHQRLEFEIKSKENEFIAKFLNHALDQNPERRRDFAEYFFRLAPTEETRKRWREYRDYASGLVTAAIQKQAEIDSKEKELAAEKERLLRSNTNIPEKDKKLIELEEALKKSRQELAALRSQPSSSLNSQIALNIPYVDDPLLSDILDKIIARAGVWSESPRDPGGASMYGITLAVLKRFAGDDTTKSDLKSLTIAQAKAIYKILYADELRLNELPEAIWEIMMDSAINSGSGRAILWLQSVCHDNSEESESDRVIGSKTIACAKNLNKSLGDTLIVQIATKRLEFLKSLDAFSTFGRAWVGRINSILPKDTKPFSAE